MGRKHGLKEDEIAKPQYTCEANRSQAGGLVGVRLRYAALKILKSHSVACLVSSFNYVYSLSTSAAVGTHSFSWPQLWAWERFPLAHYDSLYEFNSIQVHLCWFTFTMLTGSSFQLSLLALFRNVLLLNHGPVHVAQWNVYSGLQWPLRRRDN